MALSGSELLIVTERYHLCDGIMERGDIVFGYPKSGFKGDPVQTADQLQEIYDHLKAATGENPTTAFGHRCVIGFRHPSKEDHGIDCQPGWLPHSINIPWGHLRFIDQPIEAATHELAHPFVELLGQKFDLSRSIDPFSGWVEGLCDFLRIGPFVAVGQVGIARGREALYLKAALDKKSDKYHDPAGRLLKAMRSDGLDPHKAVEVKKFLTEKLPLGLTSLYGSV